MPAAAPLIGTGARRGLSSVLAALLAGCTLGPDFKPPQPPVAANFAVGIDSELANPGSEAVRQRLDYARQLSRDWWQLFHSPALDSLVAKALAGNQSLDAARSTLARARATAAEALGGRYPQVDFPANASRLKTSLLSEGINALGPTANNFAIGPTVSYALDLFGAGRRLVEKQNALVAFQRYQLDGAYLAVTGNLVRNAITVAALQAQIDAAQSVVEDDKQILTNLDRLVRLHYRSRVELEAARARLASDQAILAVLHVEQGLATDQLAILTGAIPDAPQKTALTFEGLQLPSPIPVGVPSTLARRRPDVCAAEAQLHAASAAVGIATAQLYPSLTLSAGLTQESLSASTLMTSSATGWIAAAGVAAPLFHGGALRARKQGAIEDYKIAYADYQQTVLQAFAQVADSLQALDQDAQLLETQRRLVRAGEADLDASRALFAVKRVDILRILTSQHDLDQARLRYLQAESGRYLDTVQLFGALGGGWLDRQ